MILNFTLDNGAKKPEKAHSTDAGFDLFLREKLVIMANSESILVDTGVHIEIPNGYMGLCLPRSSISKKGILIHTGVIDAGYTGSIKINVQNILNYPVSFEQGERIAQLVILSSPYFELDQVSILRKTERGDHGFGSSGK